MKTLKNRLKDKIENCYLLQGDDYYLFERGLAMIKKACNITLEDFDFQKFDDENFAAQTLVDSAQVLPLGGGHRLLAVKNVTKLTESDKKTILEYLKNPVPSTVIVFVDFPGKLDFLKGHAALVDCKRFDRATASAVLVNEFTKRGKQISGEAVTALLDASNGYLTRAINEVDKLSYYDLSDPLITRKLVEQMVTKDAEYVVFELTDALGRRDGDKAIKILQTLDKEPGILGLITNHFRRLFFIATSDLDDKALSGLLGVKEFAISKQRTQVKNFSKMQLKKIYALLQKVDFAIKSGQMLQDNALYFLILSILYV